MLTALLASPTPAYFLEAHDALSAKIAKAAGFEGLWVSSLALSTTHGVTDDNLLSTDEILHATAYIVDATDLPVLLDGDSGHGGPQQVARFMKRAARVGVHAVSIEDQVFPKHNSLSDAVHALESIERQCAKLRAAKNAAPETVLIARVESFIVGESSAEAFERAHAYREAGADAIFIHSRAKQPDEILAFCRELSGCPKLIAPTTYGHTDPSEFAQLDARGNSIVSGVIWANHMLRASYAGMVEAAGELRKQRRNLPRLDTDAPVSTILALHDDTRR